MSEKAKVVSEPQVGSADDDQCASVWFGRLERALICGELELAVEADRALRRLGFSIRFSLGPVVDMSVRPFVTAKPVEDRQSRVALKAKPVADANGRRL